MKFIKDPEGMDLSVIHKHLTDEEAEEISAYIQAYKASNGKKPLSLKVEVADKKDLDLLIALLQRLNMKWTLAGG